MRKPFLAFLIILSAALAFSQSVHPPLKYEPATVVSVNPSSSEANPGATDTVYEVTVRVGNTLYVTRNTTPSGTNTIRYVVGREVLVHVGEKTITWNDIMGQSHEVPIISRSLIADTVPAPRQ